jgi:hypothetical protein
MNENFEKLHFCLDKDGCIRRYTIVIRDHVIQQYRTVYGEIRHVHSHLQGYTDSVIVDLGTRSNAHIILGTGRVFFDRAWPADLAFPTGPDRPIDILDSTGKKPVRLIY